MSRENFPDLFFIFPEKPEENFPVNSGW